MQDGVKNGSLIDQCEFCPYNFAECWSYFQKFFHGAKCECAANVQQSRCYRSHHTLNV